MKAQLPSLPPFTSSQMSFRAAGKHLENSLGKVSHLHVYERQKDLVQPCLSPGFVCFQDEKEKAVPANE